MTNNLDFNNAGKQKSFEAIPDGTLCVVHLRIKPGGVGQEGWLTRAETKKGTSENLNCEFTVVSSPYNKRRLWSRMTVSGSNHAEAIEISQKMLRAILESARGVRPDDESPAAQEKRRVKSWGEFDHLIFMARLGVKPPEDGREAKNTIKMVITPDMDEWKKPEPPANGAPVGGGPTNGGGAAAATDAAPPPGNTIARPQWAQPEK